MFYISKEIFFSFFNKIDIESLFDLYPWLNIDVIGKQLLEFTKKKKLKSEALLDGMSYNFVYPNGRI